MAKRVLTGLIICMLLLMAGCELTPAGQPVQPTQQGISDSNIATLSAVSTQIYQATQAAVLAPTLTPTAEIIVEPTFTATATTAPGTIVITSVTEKSQTSALVTWDVAGDFPSGFKVVWTDQQGNPTYPESNSLAVGSSTARSALISVNPGTIYYVRVCRYMYEACDIYSNLSIFAITPATATPDPGPAKTATAVAGIKTATAAALPINKTAAASGTTTDPNFKITLVKGGETGKAYMAWTDSSNSTKGYKIVYSKTSTTPTLGTSSYFYVTDPAARSAYVDGESGTKYYYRVCRYDGSTCTSYTPTYTFTFPTDTSTIAISSITNTGIGTAQVNWSASGTFTNGFKILYSKTTALPTLSDSVVVVSDGAARSATISGDPSATYHVRICKYSGSTCTLYSSVMDFTFSDDTSTISITGITDTATGAAQVNWDATGTFPSGFKILYSKTTALPTLSDSVVVVSDGSLRQGTITGDPSALYHVRVCKYSGSACTIYSAVTDFTFADDPATIAFEKVQDNPTTPGTIDVGWTATGTFTNGFKLLYSTTEASPTYENASSVTISDGAVRVGSITGAANTKYYLRVCKFSGSTCGVMGDVVTFTTASTGIVLAATADRDVYNWTLTPDVDHVGGYRLFWSAGRITPEWTALLDQQASSADSDRSMTLAPAIPDATYVLRLCTWNTAESKCDAFSNTLEVAPIP